MAAVLPSMFLLLHSTQHTWAASVDVEYALFPVWTSCFARHSKVSCIRKLQLQLLDVGAQIAMMKEVAVGCKISVW